MACVLLQGWTRGSCGACLRQTNRRLGYVVNVTLHGSTECQRLHAYERHVKERCRLLALLQTEYELNVVEAPVKVVQVLPGETPPEDEDTYWWESGTSDWRQYIVTAPILSL